MGIVGSLNIGAAGMRSHGDAIEVVSDNITNVNTVGFKHSRANFRDQLAAATAGGGGNARPNAGQGSRMASVEQMWSQGALLTTEAPTDLAVSGEGFFVVEGSASGLFGQYYTRAGQFKINDEGKLVNPEGLHVQGNAINTDGSVDPRVDDLVVDPGTVPAQVSSQIDVAVQLDANAANLGPWPNPVTDPAAESSFATTITIYDSLGNDHETTLYFRKTAENTWDWKGFVDGGEVNGGTSGTPVEIINGNLTFGTNGALQQDTTNGGTVDFLGATAGQPLTVDFGTSIADNPAASGFEATTQFGTPSTVNAIRQDGFASGTVAALTIGQDGLINGIFTNGQKRAIGQVVLADFASKDGLQRMGDSLWSATTDSGEALIGAANSGSRGAVLSGALEQSNVDIGREFVNLIAYQRGFTASSKIIKTADQMYTETVMLKR